MRDPFNLSKPPASNPEPIWIKQPLSYKMLDPFSFSKSRSLKSFPTPSPSLPEASSLLSNENNLNIRRNNEKGKTISSALRRWIAFHSASLRKNPNAPLALWPSALSAPKAPCARAARARPSARVRPPVCARSARPPRGPPRVPRAAGSHPTQGVSISTALAKHRSEYMRSVFIRSNLTRVGCCRGA